MAVRYLRYSERISLFRFLFLDDMPKPLRKKFAPLIKRRNRRILLENRNNLRVASAFLVRNCLRARLLRRK